MIEITVWLLILVTDGSYNRGSVTELAKFSSAKECQRVAQLIPDNGGKNNLRRCIQATILVPK